MDVSSSEFNIQKTCRVCSDEESEMSLLFNDDSEYNKLLRECCNIQVDEGDGLPEVICQNCIKELMQTHLFISKCQETDTKLRFLLQLKIKTESEESDDRDEKLNDIEIKNEYDTDFLDDSEIPNDDIKGEFDQKDDYGLFSIKDENCQQKLKKKSNGLPKKCSKCSLLFKTKTLLLLHMKIHKDKNKYHCKACDISYKTKKEFLNHMSDHKKAGKFSEFECDYCKKHFFKKPDLRTHIRIHTGETPYSCKTCSRSFNQVSSLIRHVKLHTGDRSFKCHICSKAFYTAQCVKKHLIVHSTEKNVPCTECNAMFKCKQTLKSHIAIVHKNSRSVMCEHCGIYISTPGNLNVHRIKFHSDLSGFCFICNKDFKNITEHNLQHSGEKPHECETCGKKFSKRRSLIVHKVTHNAVQYACGYDKCNKIYSSKSMLTIHLKFHEKQPPHTCKYCNRGFYRPSDLSRHLNLSHSDQPKLLAEIKHIRKPSKPTNS